MLSLVVVVHPWWAPCTNSSSRIGSGIFFSVAASGVSLGVPVADIVARRALNNLLSIPRKQVWKSVQSRFPPARANTMANAPTHTVHQTHILDMCGSGTAPIRMLGFPKHGELKIPLTCKVSKPAQMPNGHASSIYPMRYF